MSAHRCTRCGSLAVVRDHVNRAGEALPTDVALCLACGRTVDIPTARPVVELPLEPLRAAAKRVRDEETERIRERLRRWRDGD